MRAAIAKTIAELEIELAIAKIQKAQKKQATYVFNGHKLTREDLEVWLESTHRKHQLHDHAMIGNLHNTFICRLRKGEPVIRSSDFGQLYY